MSKLKLDLENFKGEFEGKYKVKASMRGIHVVLTLKILFMGNWINADYIYSESILNEGTTFSENMEYVLKEASDSWGLELTNAILNLA